MDSQWNNWHFAKFASQEPDAFAWQIAPMFVILALIITIIPLYAVLPIKEHYANSHYIKTKSFR